VVLLVRVLHDRLDYHCTAGLSRCKPLGTAQPVTPPSDAATADTADTAAAATAANAAFGQGSVFEAPNKQQQQQDTAISTAATDSQVC
jgi:hypothetical protein